jgi:lysophospholipase L1-like esterase
MAESNHHDDSAGAAPSLTRRKKVLFSIIAVLCCLVLLEGLSRLIIEVTPNARWQHHSNLVDTIGFPALNKVLEPDPELFWRVKANLDGLQLVGEIAGSGPLRFSLSTDDRGFRRMPDARDAHHSVLFLGDSCLFGVGVNDEQAIPALVQQRMDGVRCINAAVPGYSSYQGRRFIERIKLPSPPDVVVINFGFNDSATWDHLSDLEHMALLRAERSSIVNWLKFPQLLRGLFVRREAVSSEQGRPFRPRLNDEEFADQINLIIRHCGNAGTRPVLVVWPDRLQMSEPIDHSKQAVLKRIALRHQVPLVDAVSLFRAHGGTDLFADRIHANSEGCEVMARKLEPVIRAQLDSASRAAGG